MGERGRGGGERATVNDEVSREVLEITLGLSSVKVSASVNLMCINLVRINLVCVNLFCVHLLRIDLSRVNLIVYY